jgi:hypothetical protein
MHIIETHAYLNKNFLLSLIFEGKIEGKMLKSARFAIKTGALA